MKLSSLAGRPLALMVALAGIGGLVQGARADDVDKAQIEAMRQGLSKYQDPYVAVRDLYLSTVGCVYYDGSKMEGHMDYPKGAMGVHFVNVTIQGPPDPLKPNVLIYEPGKKGKLTLVSAEWLVPLSAVKEQP